MKKTLLFAAPWLGLILCGCSDDDLATTSSGTDSEAPAPYSLTALTEGSEAETRTEFSAPDDSQTGSPIQVKWTNGDYVSLFRWYKNVADGQENPQSNYTQLVANRGGETQCTLSGELQAGIQESDYRLLLYPDQIMAQCQSNEVDKLIHVVLPVVQEATAGSADPQATLMVARVAKSENTAHFRHACSYLAIKPTYSCRAIEIESLDPSHMLAGEVTIDWNDGTPLTSAMSFDGQATALHYGAPHVTLTGNIEAGQTYYVAVVPGSMTQGIRVTSFADDQYSQVINQNIVIPVRGKYHDLSQHLPAAPATTMTVDLGLTSGTLWSTMNLGATTPEGCGDYYSWGESAPLWGFDATYTREPNYDYGFHKPIADWDQYRWGDFYDHESIRERFVSKYYAEGGILTTEDMAPAHIWGSDWRIPTEAQMQELIDGCSWQLVYRPSTQSVFDGIDGYLGTSTNGNTIFLPLTGYYGYESPSSTSGRHVSRQWINTYYWTSTVSETDEQGRNAYYSCARCLALDQDQAAERLWSLYRYCALPIRPVKN